MLRTTGLAVLGLLMPEFTMNWSPCSFKQQEEDELNPLCWSPLSPHRPKGRDKTGRSSRCPHRIQWKVLCAAFVVTRNKGSQAVSSHEDSLDGHLGQYEKCDFQVRKWSHSTTAGPRSLGWHGHSSCVGFYLLSPLPLIAASFLYLTMSVYSKAVSYAFLSTLLLFISL